MCLWSFGLMERSEAFRFHTPSSLLVVGPSGCGKTVFTTKLLLNNLYLFHTDSQSPLKGRRMHAMSQIHQGIVMNCSQDSITTVSLMNGAKKRALLVNKDLLYRLDGLFAFYHHQWWCHRQMFYHLSGAMVV